jgi:hypothetical protein
MEGEQEAPIEPSSISLTRENKLPVLCSEESPRFLEMRAITVIKEIFI